MYTTKATNEGFNQVTVYAIAFDAIWTLAKALNYTETMRKSKNTQQIVAETNCSNLEGELVPLNEFEYSNAFMGCVLRYSFHQTRFLGMTVSKTTINVNALPMHIFLIFAGKRFIWN